MKPLQKSTLHPRNKHQGQYDFTVLITCVEELREFVQTNVYGNLSIDFANPEAVKLLNKALLKQYYGIDNWDIPEGFLCPPIPGRADYIHYLADLLSDTQKGKIPKGYKIRGLDIGVGANCIYPIIANQEYAWSMVGSEINPKAIDAAQAIVNANEGLKRSVEIRHQPTEAHIFENIIDKEEYFDFTICNPPFHASEADANAANTRKINNLNKKESSKATLNFGGNESELWYKGGELAFIKLMIQESKNYATSCFWFTTLVSKKSNLNAINQFLDEHNIQERKTIDMAQGNKMSRFVAWTFLNTKQQNIWKKTRWL